MHATAFLKAKSLPETGSSVVLSGKERALKLSVIEAVAREILGADEAEQASLVRLPGIDIDLASVRDELATVSMWSDRRLVVVEDADEFVKNYRAGLEKYLDKPSRKSLLVLDVTSWPKNTRLAKRIDKEGLLVECTELKGAALSGWIQDTAGRVYGKSITRDAARLLPELAGSAIGLLEQELAKLASYVGERESIGVDDVRTLVGGWKAETTWAMLDALTAGNLPLALTCLEKLLVAGEAPQKILGGIAFVFRKLAVATELARQGRPLTRALADAGVFANKISSSSQYLRRIGRPHAERILAWLLEADFGMKGGGRLSEQMQLERLLVRLSGAA